MRAAGPLPAKLSAAALDHPAFPPARCEALFAAVLVNDEVDAETALPPAIHLDYTREQLTQCFRLCRQVWRQGVERSALRRMVAEIARARTVPPHDRVAFKEVRAKFKHLRFAAAAFDARHRYPPWFDRMTQVMGRLQDAFRNGQRGVVARQAALLWLCLGRAPFALVAREIDDFRPADPAGFRAYVLDQVATIRADLACPAITPKRFHQLRKIVSRQVAQYDSLRTLYPSAHHDAIARYLGTINGLMGGLHDELVERTVRGAMDYHHDPFPIPDDIRARLAMFASRFSPEE